MFEVWYNMHWKSAKQERKTLRGAEQVVARQRKELERLTQVYLMRIPRGIMIVHPGGGKGATMRDLNVRKQNSGMHRLSKMVVPFRIVS